MRPYIHGRGRPGHIGRDEIPVEGIYPVAFFIGKEGAGSHHGQCLFDRGFLGRGAPSRCSRLPPVETARRAVSMTRDVPAERLYG